MFSEFSVVSGICFFLSNAILPLPIMNRPGLSPPMLVPCYGAVTLYWLQSFHSTI